MRARQVLFVVTSALLLPGMIDAGPAQALVIQQNVNFAAVNRNPWTGGPAFSSEWHLSQPAVSGTFDLPKLDGNPINIIADFLGVDLPLSANVGVGGTVSGSAGFDFGYYVSGGKLNVNYPALSTLNVQTTAPDNNRVVAGTSFTIGTQFTPGLNTVSPPLTPAYVAAAGAGYEVLMQNVSLGTTMKDPFLKTTFPYASAWANFGYDLKAGAFVEATAKVFGACIVCARKEMTFGDARDFTLIEIDPGGKGQPPVVRFLGNEVSPFQPIQVGPAKITFSYPDVAVQGALQPDRSVFGTDSKSIIAVQGSIEKLVPFIGPFLTAGIGPVGYQLLSTDGGPSLGLYQDFRFTPDPRVQLAFSQPVLLRGADGKYTATNTIEFALGQSLDLIAPLTLGSDNLRVQPTYFLNNTVHNQTGLSLGVQFDVDLLQLNSPFGPLGPALDSTLSYELARMPLFDQAFSLNLAAITGRPFELDVIFPIAAALQDRFVLHDVFFNDGEGDYGIILRDVLTGDLYGNNFDGEEVAFGEGPLAQKLLLTDEDVVINGFNLGRAFCLVCVDASDFVFEVESPFITQDDQILFLSDLFDFPTGEIDIAGHPILGTSNFRDDHRPVTTEVGPTILTVPEPGALALFATGLAALAFMRRRRPA